MKIFLALFLALPVSLFSQGTIFSSITRTNVLTPTNLFLVSTPVAGGTRTIYLSDVKRAAGIGTEQSLGTIANGGTATLLLTTNVTSAIYSGATATIALPSISGATNAYVLYHAGTNTSGGSQVITFPALIRDEMDSDTPITTITNNTAAAFRMAFTSVAGVWRNVDASGDALSFSAASVTYAAVTNALSLTGSTSTFVRSDGTQATPAGGGSPGGDVLSLQYNSNGVFNGFGSWSNSPAVATIPNVTVVTNLIVLGTTNATIEFYDGDGDKFAEFGAPPVIATNSVTYLPTTPNIGALVGASVTLATNVQTEFVGAPLTVYAAGTAYSLTGTSAALDFGTTDPSLVISHAGTYLLIGRTVVRYNGATFAANQTLTLKLRRTNNTATDIANSTGSYTTDITTTRTANFIQIGVAPVIYTTANADDAIAVFGNISVVPSAGSLDATAASILAIRLY